MLPTRYHASMARKTRIIEGAALLAGWGLRLILIGVILAAVVVLLRQEGCVGTFCDH